MAQSGYPAGADATAAKHETPDASDRADPQSEDAARPRAFSKPLPLTRPPVLIGLVLAIALFGAAIAVAATTDIQARVQGKGMVVSGGSFIPVVSPVAGQVSGSPAGEGTAVAAGQSVAEVVQADGTRTSVVAPSGGTVLAVLAVAGEVVTPGQPIAQMANTGEPLQVTAFYSIPDAAKIRLGMPAQIYTADSNVNSSSFTDATVTGIADYVATQDVIATLVGGDELVSYLTRDGPVVVITMTFPGSPTDARDLQWSGEKPARFGNGSVVDSAVVVGEQTVLSLVRSS